MACDLGVIDHPASKAIGGLTLQVRLTGLPIMRTRLWLGARILRLAAWVIGCDVEIETASKGPTKGFADGTPSV